MKIKSIAKKAQKTKEFNKNDTTKKEYYTSRGMSEEESIIALSERQTTFSKEICIEKYGEDDEIKVWEDRQTKWMNTLNSKSSEELEIIRRKKLSGARFSKISQKLFNSLGISDDRYAKQGGEQRIKISPTTYICSDYTLNSKVIEFNGDLWHANPNI